MSPSTSCYYQLQVVSRSLSHDTALVLWSSVHAFDTSRTDHCCSILARLPLGVLGVSVIRSAAGLIGHIFKYASVSVFMCDVSRCLPVTQRISYRIAALVSCYLLGCAPSYIPMRPLSPGVRRCSTSGASSSTRGELLTPWTRSSTMQHQTFSDVAPSTWNGLPWDCAYTAFEQSICVP